MPQLAGVREPYWCIILAISFGQSEASDLICAHIKRTLAIPEVSVIWNDDDLQNYLMVPKLRDLPPGPVFQLDMARPAQA